MEEVIEIASKIKDCLVSLCDFYCKLPNLIELEHEFIRNHEFDKVREITMQKNNIGDEIEVQFSVMRGLTERISMKHEAITNTLLQNSKASGIRAIIDRLVDIKKCSKQDGMAGQVLDHLIEGLKEKLDLFDAKMIEIQPLVEMNKKVVGTMLTSYRESYRFWQELAEENVSAYSKDGVQKAQGRLSGFAVKA